MTDPRFLEGEGGPVGADSGVKEAPESLVEDFLVGIGGGGPPLLGAAEVVVAGGVPSIAGGRGGGGGGGGGGGMGVA